MTIVDHAGQVAHEQRARGVHDEAAVHAVDVLE